MLEKYGIRHDKRIRLYTQAELDKDKSYYFYLALYNFDNGQYDAAIDCITPFENTDEGPLVKFILGISNYKLGETALAIEKLVDFCIAPIHIQGTLVKRVKNPHALRNMAEDILVRLLGNQIGHAIKEEEYLKVPIDGLVTIEINGLDNLDNYVDFTFDKRLSHGTRLKIIDYLFENGKINDKTHLHERNYILACITKSKGLHLKAVAEYINEGYEGNRKAKEAVGHLVGFNHNNDTTFTNDLFRAYKTMESMHAHAIIDTNTYVTKLKEIKAELPDSSIEYVAPGSERVVGGSSSTESSIEVSYESTVVPNAEPVEFDAQKFKSTINRQLALHDPELRNKDAVELFFATDKEEKLSALKERVFAQNIMRTYYKDVWNTVSLSNTAPMALQILFFIPRAIITALSTLWLAPHALIEIYTSTEIKLAKLAQASIDSKLKKESDPKSNCHQFFKNWSSAVPAPVAVRRQSQRQERSL